MSTLAEELKKFEEQYSVIDKGALSVLVTLTRDFQSTVFPIDGRNLRTPKGGQVTGLSGAKLRRILSEHGISRTLSSEGGRTSRGSIHLAESYAALLNRLHGKGILVLPDGLKQVEKWWVSRVREYFNKEAFQVHLDMSLSISSVVAEILEVARKRQQELSGTMVVGTVLEHLVGAKLELICGADRVSHKKTSESDEATNSPGDFQIGETVLHCTTAPSPALVHKCMRNIATGLRPIIVCPAGFVEATRRFASAAGADTRIEVFEAEQFISSNLNELGEFTRTGLSQNARQFVEKYNEIVRSVEGDSSLTIEHC